MRFRSNAHTHSTYCDGKSTVREMLEKAKELGSDYIVVGRPITAAADPVAAYERCVAEFCD